MLLLIAPLFILTNSFADAFTGAAVIEARPSDFVYDGRSYKLQESVQLYNSLEIWNCLKPREVLIPGFNRSNLQLLRSYSVEFVCTGDNRLCDASIVSGGSFINTDGRTNEEPILQFQIGTANGNGNGNRCALTYADIDQLNHCTEMQDLLRPGSSVCALMFHVLLTLTYEYSSGTYTQEYYAWSVYVPFNRDPVLSAECATQTCTSTTPAYSTRIDNDAGHVTTSAAQTDTDQTVSTDQSQSSIDLDTTESAETSPGFTSTKTQPVGTTEMLSSSNYATNASEVYTMKPTVKTTGQTSPITSSSATSKVSTTVATRATSTAASDQTTVNSTVESVAVEDGNSWNVSIGPLVVQIDFTVGLFLIGSSVLVVVMVAVVSIVLCKFCKKSPQRSANDLGVSKSELQYFSFIGNPESESASKLQTARQSKYEMYSQASIMTPEHNNILACSDAFSNLTCNSSSDATEISVDCAQEAQKKRMTMSSFSASHR